MYYRHIFFSFLQLDFSVFSFCGFFAWRKIILLQKQSDLQAHEDYWLCRNVAPMCTFEYNKLIIKYTLNMSEVGGFFVDNFFRLLQAFLLGWVPAIQKSCSLSSLWTFDINCMHITLTYHPVAPKLSNQYTLRQLARKR